MSTHQRELASPLESGQQAIIEQGSEVGRAAHALFPGGVLVEESSARFADAAARTRALLDDSSIPALFEPAFEHAGVRIRVDVLERLGPGRFGLREVKSATSVKDKHLPDMAVQLWVLRGNGLEVPSVELVHIDKRYIRDTSEIDWPRFFVRSDRTLEVDALLAEVSDQVAAMHEVLGRPDSPAIDPGSHCKKPFLCEFWKHCTATKSPAWFVRQMRAKAELSAHRLEAARTGQTWISGALAVSLQDAEPPVWYLDFEALAPAIPLYPGTHPFEALPFQWSLHRLDANGGGSHFEFLARGNEDPCRETSERLLDVLSQDSAPIVVYSPFEGRMLAKMALRNPDRAGELRELRARLFDLLPLLRRSIYDAGFLGSFSIKSVAPVLAPEVRYDDLGDLAEGNAAASAFVRIAVGGSAATEEARLRSALLAYCERDTYALMEVHQALRRCVGLG